MGYTVSPLEHIHGEFTGVFPLNRDMQWSPFGVPIMVTPPDIGVPIWRPPYIMVFPGVGRPTGIRGDPIMTPFRPLNDPIIGTLNRV